MTFHLHNMVVCLLVPIIQSLPYTALFQVRISNQYLKRSLRISPHRQARPSYLFLKETTWAPWGSEMVSQSSAHGKHKVIFVLSFIIQKKNMHLYCKETSISTEDLHFLYKCSNK